MFAFCSRLDEKCCWIVSCLFVLSVIVQTKKQPKINGIILHQNLIRIWKLLICVWKKSDVFFLLSKLTTKKKKNFCCLWFCFCLFLSNFWFRLFRLFHFFSFEFVFWDFHSLAVLSFGFWSSKRKNSRMEAIIFPKKELSFENVCFLQSIWCEISLQKIGLFVCLVCDRPTKKQLRFNGLILHQNSTLIWRLLILFGNLRCVVWEGSLMTADWWLFLLIFFPFVFSFDFVFLGKCWSHDLAVLSFGSWSSERKKQPHLLKRKNSLLKMFAVVLRRSVNGSRMFVCFVCDRRNKKKKTADIRWFLKFVYLRSLIIF